MRSVPGGVFFLQSAPECRATLTPELLLVDNEGNVWEDIRQWIHARGKGDSLHIEDDLLLGNEKGEGQRIYGFHTVAAIACAAHGLTLDTWIRACLSYRIYGDGHLPSSPTTSFADKVLAFVAEYREGRFPNPATAARAMAGDIDEELYV